MSANTSSETSSMHAFELRAERPASTAPECCNAPLTDAFATRAAYRLRLSERYLGDAVPGDDVAIRQQVAGGVLVLIVEILWAPATRASFSSASPRPHWSEQRVQCVHVHRVAP